MPKVICFKFDWQDARRAFSLALANTGNRIAARIAIMAMTTSNSINGRIFFQPQKGTALDCRPKL
jgi:hypothetical protein